MAEELTEHVMVRLSHDLLKQVIANAVENERTVAQTVRLAIKRYLAAEGADA